jgi:hypothetical protein
MVKRAQEAGFERQASKINALLGADQFLSCAIVNWQTWPWGHREQSQSYSPQTHQQLEDRSRSYSLRSLCTSYRLWPTYT